jgi:hypothetical protein
MKRKGTGDPFVQREAMCITFLPSASPIHADKTSCRFAVRLYAGGANVVSNKPSAETETEKQDYYVLSL